MAEIQLTEAEITKQLAEIQSKLESISSNDRAYLEEDEIVVELKYGCEQEARAAPVVGAFPFRISKSSKYATGVQLTAP